MSGIKREQEAQEGVGRETPTLEKVRLAIDKARGKLTPPERTDLDRFTITRTIQDIEKKPPTGRPEELEAARKFKDIVGEELGIG